MIKYFGQLLVFIALINLTPIRGSYMAKAFQGQKTWLHPSLGWLEGLCYRLSGAGFSEIHQGYLKVENCPEEGVAKFSLFLPRISHG